MVMNRVCTVMSRAITDSTRLKARAIRLRTRLTRLRILHTDFYPCLVIAAIIVQAIVQLYALFTATVAVMSPINTYQNPTKTLSSGR